ncbi:MAG: hypothetical protein PVG39_11405 [Desulfobacteraceae bacterium]|jgi:hypothetical protein
MCQIGDGHLKLRDKYNFSVKRVAIGSGGLPGYSVKVGCKIYEVENFMNVIEIFMVYAFDPVKFEAGAKMRFKMWEK